jgi:hypothetical protein
MDAQNSLGRSLSAALVGVRLGAGAAEETAPDREPLQRQSTTEMNRNRVHENQQVLAAQMLTSCLPIMACLGILMLILVLTGLVIYIQGWVVLFHVMFPSTQRKTCDQPLECWLAVMLLVPILQVQLNNGEQSNRHITKLRAWIMPIGIVVGVWMYQHSKTCVQTNPELFHYTRTYLCYQLMWCVIMVFASCGLVSLIFWLHRNGLLDQGGPASPAREGLVRDLETVQFHRSNFSTSDDDDLEPPECSICQEEYQEDEEIKKTPCGHYFHENCLGQWLERYARSCPLCRKDLEEALDQRDGGA